MKTVSRMDITVPKELREKMSKLHGINWSAVATCAFEMIVRGSTTDRMLTVLKEDNARLRKRLEEIRDLADSK